MSIQNKNEARKDTIIQAGLRIFAEKGFQDATISDIAKEAGISDPTIYEYFSTKEELLFSIPEKISEIGIEVFKENIKYVRNCADKLRAIVHITLSFYQNNPDYASIIVLILKQNRKFLETDAYTVIRKWFQVIIQIVKEGIEKGEFKPETDPYLIRAIILGTIEHTVTNWLFKKHPKDLLSYADTLIDIIVEGIKMSDELQGWDVNISLKPRSGKNQKKPDEV